MSILSIGELLDMGNSASTAGLVPYSALEYNASGDISGISGSAIAGGVDSAVVSSIVSSYVQSSVSGKADQSALEDCCSAMSAIVSAKLDASASGNFAPSGDYYSATNPSGFITTADITGKLDSTASSLFQPSGDYADASSLSGKLDASASGMFQPSGEYAPTGDYALNSSLSSKLDASASSQFYPMTGNPSGFLTGVDLTDYATTAYVDSSVSGKLDASASGQFQPSGEYYPASNPSGFITGVDLSNYATTAYVDSSVSGKVDQSAFDDCCSSVQSALSGKLDASASGEFYPSGNPSGFISGITTDFPLTGNGQPGSALGIEKYDLALDTSMYSSLEGNTLTIGAYGGGGSGPTGNFWPQVILNDYSASAVDTGYSYNVMASADGITYTSELGATGTTVSRPGRSARMITDNVSVYRTASSASSVTELNPSGLVSVGSGSSEGEIRIYRSGASGYDGSTHEAWSLNGSCVSGRDSSYQTWQLGKTEYDYWNNKMDSVQSAELVGASGIIITLSGDKYVISLDAAHYRP